MLDIKFIRENKDIVAEGAKKKHIDVDIDALIKADDKRLQLLSESEALRSEQNRMNNTIAIEKDFTARQQLINEMKLVKDDFKIKEDELREVILKMKMLKLMSGVKNQILILNQKIIWK